MHEVAKFKENKSSVHGECETLHLYWEWKITGFQSRIVKNGLGPEHLLFLEVEPRTHLLTSNFSLQIMVPQTIEMEQMSIGNTT